MKALLDRLHAKLGDLWWYSLMIFVACRAADMINVFVGLWLVPKYVDPSELGAVMPLTSFANFLALPVSIFSMALSKEVNTLAAHNEHGKMKTLLRGVFISTAVGFFVAIICCRILMPYFLERIRIVEGSLGLLILVSALISCISPVFSNTLQAFKKFKEYSLLCCLGTPLRFLSMLIFMPIRPLSGYFIGQSASPAFAIVGSLFFLRKELGKQAESYWNTASIRRLGGLVLGIAGYCIAPGILGLVEQTVLRQRLPDLDSAAYYMVTRFSDIATYISGTVLLVLFPYTAELAEKGKNTRALTIKAILVILGGGALLAAPFLIAGKHVLSILPHGDQYASFYWAIPWLIIINTLAGIQMIHTNTEVSACRFSFLKWWIPLNLALPVILLVTTGFGYFTDLIPSSWATFLSLNNFTSLKAMLWWFTATTLIKTTISVYALLKS